MKKIIVAVPAMLMASSAFAQSKLTPVADVPEISALQGTAAIAAVAAVVLLVWERRRRAA